MSEQTLSNWHLPKIADPSTLASPFRMALEDAGVAIRRMANGVFYAKLDGQFLDYLTADTRTEAWDEVVSQFRHWTAGKEENIPVVCAALAKAVSP